MADNETSPKFAPFFGMVCVSRFQESAMGPDANAVIRVALLLRYAYHYLSFYAYHTEARR